MGLLSRRSLCALVLMAGIAAAHGGHEAVPEGSAISLEPLDTTLWIHILLMGLSFGLIFPLGMVLGMVRSRWHVPVQTVGTVIAIVAYFLGHAHKGRQFGKNVHASVANWLMLLLVVQVVLGVYLRLHLEKAFQGRIRWIFVRAHGIIGKIMPVVSWTQMLFGGITALGFCQGEHTGQCAAHFIMGSAFVAYGITLLVLLLAGQYWLRRTGRSQEFFDSAVIAAWGCVNTFTEHHWGGEWVRNDLQHTLMGVIWWCAGLLGMWMSRTRGGQPKRNIIPAIVIIQTGYSMGAHPQTLMISTMIHTFFGYTLMAAGVARIIEISFVLRDKPAIDMSGSDPNSFQFLTPFLLCASGFLFMGATEEQMQLLADADISHVAYLLILFSITFIVFLFAHILIHVYAVHVFPRDDDTETDARGKYGNANGRHGNGRVRSSSDAQRIQDAEGFELQGLVSDEEEGESSLGPRRTSDEELGRKETP
ncbi:Protein YTP1 [Penicillium taxi]|uniref:Protein YTP1 n=1 Tax=Penicillium taxi TaxID=168475 RepID=UPI0025459B11|nr:Protein YTP1 [Penicillium taxi]KAJ5888948.1 Protein YTP1 [Penicillium taxi]